MWRRLRTLSQPGPWGEQGRSDEREPLTCPDSTKRACP